jgi:hypothetical protein
VEIGPLNVRYGALNTYREISSSEIIKCARQVFDGGVQQEIRHFCSQMKMWLPEKNLLHKTFTMLFEACPVKPSFS